MATVIDPSSLSNLSEVLTKHVHLNWRISFEEKKIGGHVLLDMITLVPNVSKIVLDTSYLELKNVSLNGQALKVSQNTEFPFFFFLRTKQCY